jgi:hypothetical protein
MTRGALRAKVFQARPLRGRKEKRHVLRLSTVNIADLITIQLGTEALNVKNLSDEAASILQTNMNGEIYQISDFALKSVMRNP